LLKSRVLIFVFTTIVDHNSYPLDGGKFCRTGMANLLERCLEPR
jgi:hypothetical protein